MGREVVELNLSSGADQVSILQTHGGTTTVNTFGGLDAIDIRSIAGPTTINAGSDNDAIRVGTEAGLANTLGTLNSIDGLLTIPGQGGGGDPLVPADSGAATATTGILTAATVTVSPASRRDEDGHPVCNAGPSLLR